MSQTYLTIVIPAFNEEHRLPITLESVFAFARELPFACEILVVENGSTDQTYRVAEAYLGQYEDYHLLQSARGKGWAIQRGMLEAKGEYCFMCDADLSMPIQEITRFLPPALEGFDIAIGSREAAGAIRFDEPAYRHLGGRFINFLIRNLALPGMHDTQCGFKCFHHRVVKDLFKHQTMGGWSFDIEILYIARLRGYKITEVPIPWYFNPESKLKVLADSWKMLKDILQIRQSARKGLYDQLNISNSRAF